PDKPLAINIGPNVHVHSIKTKFRHSNLLRPLTILEFLFKSLKLLFKLKPDVVHAHDTAVVLCTYIYRIFRRNSFKLIYDDHELPNEKESTQYRIFQYFERKLIKLSDLVIVANK